MSKAPTLAVAIAVKRKAKKMAQGGEVNKPSAVVHEPIASGIKGKDTNRLNKRLQGASMEHMERENKDPKRNKIQHLAEGGIVQPKSGFKVRTSKMDQDEKHLIPTMPPEDETEHIAYDDGHALHSQQFAMGGEVTEAAEDDHAVHPAGLESDDDMLAPPEDEYMASKFARGGMVDDIMKRRKFAAGGMVDLDENAEEQPNGYYEQNEHAALKENYDSDMDSVSQPMDSNEHGHDIDSDEHDMVGSIRKRMKSRMK